MKIEKIKFFIDTADECYIKKTLDYINGQNLIGKVVSGITTNPNAMSKCDVHTIKLFEEKVRNLCELVTFIRQDALGVVYVQHPNSNVTTDELRKWIDIIMKMTDGNTKVGIKIPPYLHLLKLIHEYHSVIDFNITGIADCSTALMCYSFEPRYVSLIPGRMEEYNINANAHMKYISQSISDRYSKKSNVLTSELITGSMRTISGLKLAILYNTIPTIGTRVFDLLFSDAVEFCSMWDGVDLSGPLKFSPSVSDIQTQLSVSFFEQMDKCGEKLLRDISNNN